MALEFYNPNYYKRMPDDAAQIQAAVDAAAATGHAVVIPRRNERTGMDIWNLPRAVRLYSGSTVILDNCHLRQADGSFDNIFKSDGARTEAACSAENRLYDIRISGIGRAVLDGGKHNGLTEGTWKEMDKGPCYTNSAVHFHNVERFTVENIHVEESRYWGLTFHYCAEGRISNITFNNSGTAPNQDGIDLRVGCHDILIENIMGRTGDDVVALTCLDDWGGRMRVEGLSPDLHSVIIRNVQGATTDVRGIVRTLNHYGFKLYNVIIENVIDLSPAYGPWRAGSAVRIGENGYCRDESLLANYGDTYNITVRNVASRARHGVFISRTLENALIDNIQMYGDGGCALLFREGVYRNIRVKNLTASAECVTPDTDDSPTENCYNRRRIPDRPVEENRAYMVYFQGAHIGNLRMEGITAGKNLDAVFGGYGNVQLRARDVLRQDESVPMLDVAESVKAEITEW